LAGILRVSAIILGISAIILGRSAMATKVTMTTRVGAQILVNQNSARSGVD
jgi:hypothetical protein